MSMQGLLDGFDPPATHSAEIARVLVDVDLAHMDRLLDYVIPDSLLDQAVVVAWFACVFQGHVLTGGLLSEHDGRLAKALDALSRLFPAHPF